MQLIEALERGTFSFPLYPDGVLPPQHAQDTIDHDMAKPRVRRLVKVARYCMRSLIRSR
jgi:hypothetical protein